MLFRSVQKSEISDLGQIVQEHRRDAQIIKSYEKLLPVEEGAQRHKGLRAKLYQAEHSEELETFEAVKTKMDQFDLWEKGSSQDFEAEIAAKQERMMGITQTVDREEQRVVDLKQAQYVAEGIEQGERFVITPQYKQQKKPQQEQQRRRKEQEL